MRSLCVLFFWRSCNDIVASRCGVVVSDGVKVRLKLSAADILRLADQIISTSEAVHDAVAAVPLDQVWIPFLDTPADFLAKS